MRAKKVVLPSEKYQHLRTWIKLLGEFNSGQKQ